jgi:hypothetical protein
LNVPADAWKAIVQTEFPALLAELGVDDPDAPLPSVEQVARTLLAAGWVDSTVRPAESTDRQLSLGTAELIEYDRSHPHPAASIRSRPR